MDIWILHTQSEDKLFSFSIHFLFSDITVGTYVR